MRWPGQPVSADRVPLVLQQQYQGLAFHPIVQHAGYYWDSLEEWAQQTAIAYEHVLDAIKPLDPPLRATEQLAAEKLLVSWREIGYGPLAEKSAIGCDNPEQASRLRPYLRRLGAAIAANVDSMHADTLHEYWFGARVPIGRGKGAPFWFGGSDRESALYLGQLALQSRNFDDLEKRCLDAGGSNLGFLMTCYARIQAGRKPRPVRRYDVDGQLYETSRTGYMPKVRRVQATGFVYNLRLTPLANTITEVAKGMDIGVLTPFEDVQKHVRRNPEFVSLALDYSTYDDTIGLSTLLAWIQLVWIPVGKVCVRRGLWTDEDLNFSVDILSRAFAAPILMPPVRYGDAALLVPRLGGLPSGIRPTSIIGSTINLCARQEQADRAAIPSYGRLIFTFGDDTLIHTHPKYEDRWLRTPPVGFNEDLSPAPTYLMRQIPNGYNYLARLVMSTIQKEHMREPRSMLIAALGVRARMELLKGHPAADAYPTLLHRLGGRYRQALELSRAQQLPDMAAAATSSNPNPSSHQVEEIGMLLADLDQPENVAKIVSRFYLPYSAFLDADRTPKQVATFLRKRSSLPREIKRRKVYEGDTLSA